MNNQNIYNELVIRNNVMITPSNVIQLRNISRIWVMRNQEKKGYPSWCVLLLTFGIIFVCVSILTGLLCIEYMRELSAMIMIIIFTMFIIGLGLIIWPIVWINDKFVKIINRHFLVVGLNSGENMFFQCRDDGFLNSALDALLNSIESNASLKIDMQNCTINDSQIGGNNVVNRNTNFEGVNNGYFNTGDNATANDININASHIKQDKDWDELIKCFDYAISIMTDIEQKVILKQAKLLAEKKDKAGLKGIIKVNMDNFKNNVFSNFASSGIYEIIERLLGLIIH